MKFLLFPHKSVYFHVKCTSILYYICVLSNYYIKFIFMPIVYLVSKYIYLLAFSFQNVKFYAICNVWHSCSTPNVFCFKELPFGLCGVSLKAIFYCFALNHALLHVSCILLVSKFNANIQINWLMSIFQGIIQNPLQCVK